MPDLRGELPADLHYRHGDVIQAVNANIKGMNNKRGPANSRPPFFFVQSSGEALTGFIGDLLEGLHEVYGQGKNDGRVLLGPDLGERLEIAELEGRRVLADDRRSFAQLGGRLELALGMDDLGAAFPFPTRTVLLRDERDRR